MPGYSTVTGENTSTVSMNTLTSLYRKLVSVGSGFTVTGWDFQMSYGGEATTAATGLTTGVPVPDLGIKIAIGYGPTTFAPPSLLTNEDVSSVMWWRSMVDQQQIIIVPASTTSQQQYAWRFTHRARFQFRLTAATDFGVQLGNASASTQAFGFVASLRVFYA